MFSKRRGVFTEISENTAVILENTKKNTRKSGTEEGSSN